MTTSDSAHELWLVEVGDECMSSMQCQMIAPDLFALNDDGRSTAILPLVDQARTEDLQEAVDSCPVGAIRMTRR